MCKTLSVTESTDACLVLNGGNYRNGHCGKKHTFQFTEECRKLISAKCFTGDFFTFAIPLQRIWLL